MGVTTSDDDFASPLIKGGGKFHRFQPSGDEATMANLENPQLLDDPNLDVKLCCCKVKKTVKHELVVAGLMLIVILTGAGNSVSSRIKGQAMGPFNFFASLGNAVVYVALYYLILFARRLLGFTPAKDITYPWKLPNEEEEDEEDEEASGCAAKICKLWAKIPPFKFFLMMGLLDGLGNILGLIAQPYISGQLGSVMTQAIVGYSMLCAMLILSTRYTYWQVWGMLVIMSGTMVCLFANGLQEGRSHLGYAMLMFVSTLPNAMSFTLKELVFVKRRKLDIFVVNSSSSLFQLVLWPIFLPLTLLFDQTGGMPFTTYLRDGFKCLVGSYSFPAGSPYAAEYDCGAMPYPFLVYIAFNLAFNVALLLLLKHASALQAFMAVKAVLPVSFLLFYFKWPLIQPSPINIFIIIGLVIVIAGLIFYRLATISKDTHKPNPHYASCFATHFSVFAPSSLGAHERPINS